MEKKAKFWLKPLKLALLCGALALAGCSGDDGANGINGTNGVDGDTVTVQTLADLGLVYAGDVTAENPTLDLSQTVSLNAAGALTVHFFLTDEEGNGIDVTAIPYEMRLYVAELIPAADGPADNPGPAWDQLFRETFTPAVSAPPGTLKLVDAATGEYTYTAATTLAASTNVNRVTMRARFRFKDNNNKYIVVANPVNASYDFLQADPGTALASSGADMVTTAACESCHGVRIGNVGHGGGYTQVKTCNQCHNLNDRGVDAESDLAFMIHRIHAAGDFLTLDHGGPVSFAEVTYPQDINTCDKCHDGLEASLAYSNPTRRNCGSCHAAVDFATGVGHAGGALDNDASCSLCHSAASIESIHKPAPILANTPEFDVTISMTAPANGTHYVAGEAPVVTVTLADHATGTAVAGTVYTADQDVEGVGGVAEGLSLASLYVYGPRNEAVPVLATDTMHDPAFVAPPTQAHPLFVNELVGGVPTANDDPLVTTTAAGFSYQLLAIPAGMEAGTYMVRFEGADYGALSATDYRTSSSAFITFQVETATEEAKVSGDGCLECHGATIMHLEGAHPHYAAFDTDACLGCHDLSGNYADYIGNRVHAIHRASVTGDLHARDWSEVTFPRPANNCITCHTDTTADTPVWRTPGGVVCGGCHGADPTAVPAGFPTADPDQILREAAAAQHMQQNGADFNPTTPATLSCLVCHGEGRTADLYDTHNLIAFRPLPVDPNE